jgi:autotransporter passenger strand-loop-strand repeat protein
MIDSDDIVVGNGTEYVASGGTTISAVVSAGSQVVLSGGLAIGTTVDAEQVVSSGGHAISTVVNPRAIEKIYEGSFVGSMTISSGGLLQYEIDDTRSNLQLSGITLESGAQIETDVNSGGDLVGYSLQDYNQSIYVFSSGMTYRITMGGGPTSAGDGHSLGNEYVESGGIAIETGIASNGGQTILAGGIALGSIISGGGEVTSSGGITVGVFVSWGGREEIASGGYGLDIAVYAGGQLWSDAGALISDAVINSGGGILYQLASAVSGGQLPGITLESGAELSLVDEPGGLSVGFDIGVNGGNWVSAGGIASATTIGSRGGQWVLRGGIAVGSIVSSGGLVAVSPGGSAINGEILSGGTEIVSSGGVASGTHVGLGGLEYVVSGGKASGAVVSSGGFEQVLSGGSAVVTSGAGKYLINTGGYMELGSGVQGAVSFLGTSGRLVLDQSQSFSGTIAGLSASVPNDVVDLKDISFSGVTSSYSGNSSSGTLTISDGVHSANLHMIGNFTSASFHLSNDGGGHVQFADPAVTLFNQAAAGFGSGTAASTSAALPTSSASATIVAGHAG